jgi:hypothetical protein
MYQVGHPNCSAKESEQISSSLRVRQTAFARKQELGGEELFADAPLGFELAAMPLQCGHAIEPPRRPAFSGVILRSNSKPQPGFRQTVRYTIPWLPVALGSSLLSAVRISLSSRFPFEKAFIVKLLALLRPFRHLNVSPLRTIHSLHTGVDL